MSMNIPNFLSISRILMIPVFIIFLSYHQLEAAFAVFALAAITDALDGLLARVLNQKTTLGTFLDPLADKLLLVSAYIVFAILTLIPAWLTILVVSRDVIISLGFLTLRVNAVSVDIKPSFISKCNTVFQFVTICAVFILYIVERPNFFLSFLYWATAVLTIASGIHYIFSGLSILNNGKTGDHDNTVPGQPKGWDRPEQP